MASRRNRTINLPAPYLRRVWLDPSGIADRAAYPFCLPFLQDDFELSFDRSITIIVGENGTGKSTFLEGSPCSPALTRPAAARAISPSTIPARSK
jgi:predicted ATPase